MRKPVHHAAEVRFRDGVEVDRDAIGEVRVADRLELRPQALHQPAGGRGVQQSIATASPLSITWQ